jgi:hypothetical protein
MAGYVVQEGKVWVLILGEAGVSALRENFNINSCNGALEGDRTLPSLDSEVYFEMPIRIDRTVGPLHLLCMNEHRRQKVSVSMSE